MINTAIGINLIDVVITWKLAATRFSNMFNPAMNNRKTTEIQVAADVGKPKKLAVKKAA